MGLDSHDQDQMDDRRNRPVAGTDNPVRSRAHTPLGPAESVIAAFNEHMLLDRFNGRHDHRVREKLFDELAAVREGPRREEVILPRRSPRCRREVVEISSFFRCRVDPLV